MSTPIAIAQNFGLLSAASVLLFLFVTHYGFPAEDQRRQLIIGLILGAMSVLVVKVPIQGPFGATFDTRAGPIVLAGFFGGPIGGLIAAMIGGAARYSVGGAMVFGGTLSFFVYAATGYGFALAAKRWRREPLGLGGLVLLAGVASTLVLPCFFLDHPVETGLTVLGRFWHVFIIGNLAGIVVLGLIIEHMLAVVAERDRHKLAAEMSDLARQAAGIGLWIYDFRSDTLVWDEIEREVMGRGLNDQELNFADFRQLVHEDDIVRVEKEFEEARQTGSRCEISFRIRTESGEIRYIRAYADFFGGRPGDPDRAVGVNIDETRERALLDEINLKGSALDSAVNGILIAEADNDQPIVFVNQAFTRLTGYTPEEVLGHNCRFLNKGLRDQPGIDAIRTALAERRSCEVTIQNNRKDGSIYWNRLRLSPIRNQNGKVTHFIGVQEDVSEQIESQHAIEDARDELKAVLASAPDAIITLNADLQITSFNDAAERLFDWPRRAILNKPIDVLIPEDLRGKHRSLALSYINNPAAKAGPMSGLSMFRALKRDGEEFPALISLARFEHSGEPAVAVTAHDMTEIVTANEHLTKLSEELSEQLATAQEASAAKSRFLAHMSHELRTPLNAIIGFADIVRSFGVSRLGPDKIEGYADDIFHSGSHLLDLINDILDLSKIESDSMPISIEPYEPMTIVETAVETIKPIADSKGIAIEVDVKETPSALCDRRAMHQCLLNLLSNAVKFSASGQNVWVSVTGSNSLIRIDVKDQGIGMTPELVQQIGKPFLRANDPTVASEEGTGLGLAITQNLIERQSGIFSIKSEPGIGTTVTIGIPLQRADTAERKIALEAG